MTESGASVSRVVCILLQEMLKSEEQKREEVKGTFCGVHSSSSAPMSRLVSDQTRSSVACSIFSLVLSRLDYGNATVAVAWPVFLPAVYCTVASVCDECRRSADLIVFNIAYKPLGMSLDCFAGGVDEVADWLHWLKAALHVCRLSVLAYKTATCLSR